MIPAAARMTKLEQEFVQADDLQVDARASHENYRDENARDE